jgi:peptidoglycan/xylan/chitin deacetylase (PgdA/CDA1 family)
LQYVLFYKNTFLAENALSGLSLELSCIRWKKIYLTFDDGPHAAATPFVLDELKSTMLKQVFASEKM